MLIAIIVSLAILAFLIAFCVIYWQEVKNFFSSKFKRKKNEPKPVQKKEEPKQELKVEDFIPLRNQFDDSERDPSLEALFAEDDLVFDDFNQINNEGSVDRDKYIFDDDILLKKDKTSRNKKKSIAQQINDLSPELKALLIDTTLKKRDDV